MKTTRPSPRSDDARARVLAAMKSIQEEMDANEGTYPHNGGALSSAEVARRADIHPTTFYTHRQRELGLEVKKWLEEIKTQKIVGRRAIRLDMATRISDYRRLYEGLSQSHRDTELELQETQAQLSAALEEIKQLKAELRRAPALEGAAQYSKNVISLHSQGHQDARK